MDWCNCYQTEPAGSVLEQGFQNALDNSKIKMFSQGALFFLDTQDVRVYRIHEAII